MNLKGDNVPWLAGCFIATLATLMGLVAFTKESGTIAMGLVGLAGTALGIMGGVSKSKDAPSQTSITKTDSVQVNNEAKLP
jgi:hypothetical protein